MKIGIDVDGVLTNVEQFEIDFASKYYFINTNRHIENPYGYGSQKIFNAEVNEDNKFWSKAIYKYVKEPARRYASEVIKTLKNKGHEIFIITNRISDLSYCDISKSKMIKILKKWLKKNKIYYDKLIFSSGTKIDDLQKNKVDIMIEDTPKNIVALAKQFKILCYDAKYNQNIKCDENIIRVYSWYDILDKINNIN